MRSASALLTIKGVGAFYGKRQALRKGDMVVKRGEIVTLIGANGADKFNSHRDFMRYTAIL